MISFLVASSLLLGETLTPTGDAWAYPHASDGGRDAYLRVWGSGGKAIAEDIADVENFSYAYMKFAVPAADSGKTLKSAKLILTHIADPAYSKEFSKAYPLEVHPVGTGFEDKSWNYDLVRTLIPDKKVVFGKGWAENMTSGTEFKIEINLMGEKSTFGDYWAKAAKSDKREFGFVIAAPIDVAEVGTKSTYKFFSRDAEAEAKRPKLVVEFQ